MNDLRAQRIAELCQKLLGEQNEEQRSLLERQIRALALSQAHIIVVQQEDGAWAIPSQWIWGQRSAEEAIGHAVKTHAAEWGIIIEKSPR